MYSENTPRAAEGARSSATLICGLPRAGKTTLINYIRRNDVDLQHSMILNNCDSTAGLLSRINTRVSSGESQHLLIELPPAQDPAPVATLFANPECSGQAAQVRLDSVIVIVDASTLLSDFCSQELVAQRLPRTLGDPRSWVDALTAQIEFADLIIVNKVDRVSPQTRRNVRALLTALNPMAAQIESEFCAVPLAELIATGRFDMQRTSSSPAWSRVLAGLEIPGADAHGISAFIYHKRKPFHPQRLMDFLDDPWPGVIRTRGVFWLATRMDWQGELSQVGPVRRHRSVGYWWAAALEGRTFELRQAEEVAGVAWDLEYGDRRQELAFVGIEMDQRALRDRLDACLLTDKEIRCGREYWQGYDDPFPLWEPTLTKQRAAVAH